MADSFVPDPDPAPAKEKPVEGDKLSPLVGGVLDTMGLTNRPGARTPVDVMAKPQGGLEHVARMMVTAPAIYAGGRALAPLGAAAGLGSGAVAGNVAASGAVGAGEAALRGDNPLYGGLIDAIVAGMTEGTISGVSNLPKVGLGAMGAPARAFQWATEAPGKALEAIASRVGKGKFVNAPSLSNTKLTPKQAVDKLSELEGAKYQQAREEIANEFTRLDMQRITGPKPFAGQVFKTGTAKGRDPASTVSRGAEQARQLASDPGMRAAADAAATEDPNIVLGAALSVPSFGDIAGKLLPHAIGR